MHDLLGARHSQTLRIIDHLTKIFKKRALKTSKIMEALCSNEVGNLLTVIQTWVLILDDP